MAAFVRVFAQKATAEICPVQPLYGETGSKAREETAMHLGVRNHCLSLLQHFLP